MGCTPGPWGCTPWARRRGVPTAGRPTPIAGQLAMSALFALLALAASGCASAPGGASREAQLAAASVTLFAPPPLSAQAAHDDSLCAPIALYADPLLAEVVRAAGHRSDIAAAAHWIARHPRAQLGYEIHSAALGNRHWAPSVESLLAIPDVLPLMNAHRRWVRQLASAFEADPAALMDSIQRLRRRALLAGSLRSTSEQSVSTDGETIAIEPAQPDVLYVPYYLPRFVYGAWPWLSSPPYSLTPPASVVFSGAPVAFGIPVTVTAVPWRWYHWDWRRHRLEPTDG